MDLDAESGQIEPELIAGWVRARSVARGLPQPVADHGGWRVDTNLPQELKRYVFACAGDGLRMLAETIEQPRIFLKLCASECETRAILTPRWQVQGPSYVMTGEAYCGGEVTLAPGYSLQLSRNGAVTMVRIVTDGGELAASGYAAEEGGFFVYDRIAVEPEYQRRGLGRYLMQSLHSARRSSSSTQILVATPAGQMLYSSLGWRIRSQYTTASISA